MKLFSNEIKMRTFSRLWPGYCLFWLCKWNATHKIPGTSAVYWVTWFVESDVYQTAIKLQKNESGNCSIWNQFYIKDVYWNKFNIKTVNMSCDLRSFIFCQFIGNKKWKTVDKAEYPNYCQLSYQDKNKNVTMLHNSK
jgi:hypothetical protein